MEQLLEFGIFAGKTLIVFVFIAGLLLIVAGLVIKQKMRPELEVSDINEKLETLDEMISSVLLDKKEFKKRLKEHKKTNDKTAPKPRLFVLKFKGDIQAKGVDELRDEVTAILAVANSQDEALVKIESPGGVVHGYGLGAAQLLRLKNAGLNVTAAVDKVAASGGYMMACVAHKVISAPFAIVGSIGVVAQIPNFHKVLKKHDVDYEEITAGEYKRTVSLLGEITPKGREKFQEQIQDTHNLFKTFVSTQRPAVDIAKVATGEYWFGTRAKDIGLVDDIMTSDEFVLGRRNSHRIFEISYHAKKTFGEKLQESFAESAALASEKIWNKINNIRFF